MIRDIQKCVVLFLACLGAGVIWHGAGAEGARQGGEGFVSDEEAPAALRLLDNPPETLSFYDLLLVKDQPGVLIVDVRPGPFYRYGHIPGALNLSWREVEEDYEKLQEHISDPDRLLLVLYCGGTSCNQSRRVARYLQGAGVENISIFAGGWEAWREGGFPVAQRTDENLATSNQP